MNLLAPLLVIAFVFVIAALRSGPPPAGYA